MNKKLTALKSKIKSDDWEEIKMASDALAKIGGDDILFFLISLLNSQNQLTRNGAALALKKLGDNRAVTPLFEAIFKNPNRNGTMVYALTSLNCQHHLVSLYRILFQEAYEAKMSVFQILEEQEFSFTENDLLEIKLMWDDCVLCPHQYREFDVPKVKEQMKIALDWYISYLEE